MCFKYTLNRCGGQGVVIDSVLPTLSSYDLYSMFKDPQKSIDIITAQALNELKATLIGKGNMRSNIVYGERFRKEYSKGGHYDIISERGYYNKVKIQSVILNVNKTGLLDLYLEDEYGTLEIIQIPVEKDVTTKYELNKVYKRIKVWHTEEGKATNSVAGMLLEVEKFCDIDGYLCSIKDLIEPILVYKIASLLITEGQFSGEFNKRIMQDEDYNELKAEYETQYKLMVKTINVAESGCTNCCDKPRFAITYA